MNTATTAELADLIQPFVGKRLRGDLSASIDINARGGNHCNADVRRITAQGVEVFFYRGCDLIPWENIRSIIIRGVDPEGNWTSEASYEHRPMQRAA